MQGNLSRQFASCCFAFLLMGVVGCLTGCGFKLAGPGETITVPPLATEDVDKGCKFEMNLPDEPLADLSNASTLNQTAPAQVAALVVYERGDSSDLYNDVAVQNMATTLHMVTVFAKQCNAKSYSDIQADAAKGPGRALLAALNQYAVDTRHPEISKLKVVLSGFSAAGVLSTTMAQAFPERVLGFIPYASGSSNHDLDTVPVSAATAQIPALILANAYDPASGVQRSLRYFQRGWSQGAPWGFGVQNHTGHCCTLSTRDVMIPWVTALVSPLETGKTITTGPAVAKPKALAGGINPNVRFLCYTDGFYDSYYEYNCWIPSASILPSTDGGPQAGWLPDTDSAQAWLKWVLSPGTN